jgi:hypothetical protein
LQRTVSNLFSGVVLLLDKSIKPGDIIEVGGTYGWAPGMLPWKPGTAQSSPFPTKTLSPIR